MNRTACRRVHTTPGRERIKVPALYRDPALKHALEARLASSRGIRSVRASEVTANVLVCFDDRHHPRGILPVVRQVLGRLPARLPPPGRRLREDGAGERWHEMPVAEALRRVGATRDTGLAEPEVRRRRARWGANVLPQAQRRAASEIFAAQFRSLPVALLGGSAALSVATGGIADALVIGAVMLINATIGFATERSADRVIHELGRLGQGRAVALRGGSAAALDPGDVVPGDLLVLAPGTAVAADARVVEAHDLMVDESALTGESLPVRKDAAALARGRTPLAERTNMVFRATTVVGGTGIAVVVAVGHATQLGRIQTLLGETSAPDTPLQRQLDILGRRLVALSAPVCGAMFLLGVLRGQGMLAMLKAAIALFVAAIPEGLSAVATTVLALGVRKLRRERILVRGLHAVETLGAVQTMCLDKTGTLTQNRMQVVAASTETQSLAAIGERLPETGEDLRRLVSLAVLCNDARVQRRGSAEVTSGSATEGALLGLARAAGLDIEALRRLRPTLQSAYRTEGRPYMATLHDAGTVRLLAVKGSPMDVLALCACRSFDGAVRPLGPADRRRIEAQNATMAEAGLRVLGFAYRVLEPGERCDPAQPSELIWVGLTGIADPLRPGAAEVIARLENAGVKTAIITGDQARTAAAIGEQLGVAGNERLNVLEAARLGGLEAARLADLAGEVHVFARVSPAQKLHIVQALQRSGRIVAMTGDGINDGPALRCADVGVAMGNSGTEVARSVADVVLEDDELAALLIAVRHGRTTYDNLRTSIHFLLATNLSEIQVMLACSIACVAPPLSPMQLLWLNLVSDILPGLALAMDEDAPDVLARPPRAANEPIAGLKDARRLALQATFISAGTLAVYGWTGLRSGGGAAGTAAFTTLTCAQLLHAFSARSERHGIFHARGLAPNPLLAGATAGSLALQLAAGRVPWLRRLLGIAPLPLPALAVCAAGAVLPFLSNEAWKLAARSAPR